MGNKDRLIEAIREVPITGKTYDEYVDAVADRLSSVKTNFDRIKAMTIDDMASFFAHISERGGGFISVADHYICQKCKKEHGGKCPMSDDEGCLYENDNINTLKYWLEGEVSE